MTKEQISKLDRLVDFWLSGYRWKVYRELREENTIVAVALALHMETELAEHSGEISRDFVSAINRLAETE